MLQHSQIRIHEPLYTIPHTCIFLRCQAAGTDRAADTFLETRFGEFVDCYSQLHIH